MAAPALVFEKLRGRENFDTWKRLAKSYLIIKKCWKRVEQSLGVNATAAEIERDQQALAEITMMIESCNFSHIATATTAKEAWDALVAAYENTGLTRKVELLKQLVHIKLEDFESTQNYINAMVMTALKVNNAGLQIGDEIVASLMLAGLPNEYRALVLAVENSKTQLSVDVVKNLMLQDIKFDMHTENNVMHVKKKPTTRKRFAVILVIYLVT